MRMCVLLRLAHLARRQTHGKHIHTRQLETDKRTRQPHNHGRERCGGVGEKRATGAACELSRRLGADATGSPVTPVASSLSPLPTRQAAATLLPPTSPLASCFENVKLLPRDSKIDQLGAGWLSREQHARSRSCSRLIPRKMLFHTHRLPGVPRGAH